MPSAPENLVVNTGPIIALGKIEAFDLIRQLPLRFSIPRQVAEEIATGARLGHPVAVPPWMAIHNVAGAVLPLGQHLLDVGEAAVIQLAIERRIADVCIDEWRGRRAAISVGLRITGSLGLLGRARERGADTGGSPTGAETCSFEPSTTPFAESALSYSLRSRGANRSDAGQPGVVGCIQRKDVSHTMGQGQRGQTSIMRTFAPNLRA